MPAAVVFNDIMRKSEVFVFDISFKYPNTGVYIDVSSWTFAYKLYDANGNVIWDIANGHFTRESNSRVSFQKTALEVQALTDESYNAFFYVTNSEVTDQVWLRGTNTVEE